MAAKKARIAKKPQKEKTSERFYPSLSPEQETVIMLVTHRGKSIKQAAETVGKTYFSVYRWFDNPEFKRCMDLERERLHAELKDKYASLPDIAYNAILQNLQGENPDVKMALQLLEKSGNLVKTNAKADADEKTKRAAQALVAELQSFAEEGE